MSTSIAHRLAALAVALAFALAPADARIALAGVTGFATNDSYSVNEDRTLDVAAPGVLQNDGPASPALCVEPGSEDTSSLDGSLDLRKNGSFEFTPDENFNGVTSFTYRMGTSQTSIDGCPEGGQSNTASVTITVNPVNDPPFVSTDQCAVDIEVAEDSGPFDAAPRCVQMQDSGPLFGPGAESDHFQAWIVSTNKPELFASGPTITLDGEDPHVPAYGRLTFTPAANANGQTKVTVRGRDDGGTANGGDDTSGPTEFTIRITSVNDAPTAGADTFQALPDRALNIQAPGVLRNDADVDGDDLTAELVSSPTHGTVNLSASGAFSYTPDAGYTGADAFSYRASDGEATSPTRAVTINVTAVPSANPSAPPASAPPSAAATAGASEEPAASPSDSFPAEASASPGASVSASGSLAPGASGDPTPVDAEGGLSIPVIVVGLLLLSLLAFGGAVFVPRWLEARRAGNPPPTS